MLNSKNELPENNKIAQSEELEKKVYKVKSDLFNKVCTLTHNPELDKLSGKVLAPKKLEEANRLLRNLKTPLPK